MRDTQALGRYGEDVAARYLSSQGYEVIVRNWRSPRRDLPGELDIIARSQDCLVFCEVKTRRSIASGTPADAVTRDKVSRLRRLAGLWLSLHDARAAEIRIDVIAVMRPISGPARIEHLRGVA